MAKFKITDEVLLSMLFPGEYLHLHGASYDPSTGTVELEITGNQIPPDATEVRCLVTSSQRSYKFERVDR